MASLQLKRQVLATYRKIMRISWSWRATVPANSHEEALYIRTEARALIRKNKDVSGSDQINLSRFLTMFV